MPPNSSRLDTITKDYLGHFGIPMKNYLILHALFFALLISLTTQVAAQSGSEESKVVGVTSSDVESMAFLPSRNAPARVEAMSQSRIPAEISAVVESIEKRVGDQFKAGELLAKLDCNDQKLALQNQNSQLTRLTENWEFEKRQYTRGQQLAKQKTIGEAELDRLKTNVLIAKAQLDSQQALYNSAQIGVKRCHIVAPYNGVVVNRIANVGEMVATGSAVIEIVELANSEVSALISLTDVESYLASNSFEFESQGKRYRLNSRVLLPVVNETSRTREARLDFESSEDLVGMAGRLFWYSPFYHLPANLLQQRQGRVGVFVLDGKKAAFIETPDAQEGRPVLLTDFEQWRNKQLIVDGRHGLVHGQAVKQSGSISKASSQKELAKQPKEG